MNIDGICPYETPCGWCSKWDKKCDKRLPKQYRDPLVVSKQDHDIPTMYGKCFDCIHGTTGFPMCQDCNPDNDFKYFTERRNYQ